MVNYSDAGDVMVHNNPEWMSGAEENNIRFLITFFDWIKNWANVE